MSKSQRREEIKAITYAITKRSRQTLPFLPGDRGVTYEHEGTRWGPRFLVHFPAWRSDFWQIDTEKPRLIPLPSGSSATAESWVQSELGAAQILALSNPVGTSTKGVWRPGLNSEIDVQYALGSDVEDEIDAERALQILVEMLSDILLYVEPDDVGKRVHSHKTRDLLLLSCTEVENTFQHFLTRVVGLTQERFTTAHFVRLRKPLFLSEYVVVYRPRSSITLVSPFDGWDKEQPTQSLPWYEAYNLTKHNRQGDFRSATLEHCISSVEANLVLFCVRFGPHALLEGRGPLTSLVRHLFEVRLISSTDVTSFYIPRHVFTGNVGGVAAGNVWFNPERSVADWTRNPLKLDSPVRQRGGSKRQAGGR